MEGEVKKCVVDWLAILASLLYCHTIGKYIPKGTTRLLAILPVTCLFVFLPLNLTTMHLAGLTSFFITWLANFKLLLFAFGQGPLSSNPPIPPSLFIPVACLPIKIVQTPSSLKTEKQSKFETKENPSHQMTKRSLKSPLSYATKITLLCVLVKVHHIYKEQMHPTLKMSLYFCHIYIMLEIFLAMFAILAGALVRVELEPQFDEPHHATSVQNFWGKRWNLMVSSILRPTVYQPVRSISSRLVPKKWVSLPAVFATFLVSGAMHELIFYYLGRLEPTGEITCFFLIHGVWVCIEIVIKKELNGKLQLHPMVSGPMAIGFVLGTSFWLFFPPFMRFNPQLRGCKETLAFMKFVMHGKLVSADDVSCPYF